MPEQLTLFDPEPFTERVPAQAESQPSEVGSAEAAAYFAHRVECWLRRYTDTLTTLRAA